VGLKRIKVDFSMVDRMREKEKEQRKAELKVYIAQGGVEQ
jgi:hypothetical protein